MDMPFGLDHGWLVYVGLVVAPFVQEDAAVFAAAGASSMGVVATPTAFGLALLGLTASDTWKYWAGRYASSHAWAKRLADKPKVMAAKEKVLKHLVTAMFTARFVPGTRVPLYLAAGAFRAPFWLFFALVVATGALYLAVAFALVRILGAVAGEEVAGYTPFAAIVLAAAYFGIKALRRRPEPPAQAPGPG